MSWPMRAAVGVVALAALTAGSALDAALPLEDGDVRPFTRTGSVGHPVHLTYADVTVDAVHAARSLDSALDHVGTPGRWLLIDVVIVARGRPLERPGMSLRDAHDRTFRTDPRSGYAWSEAPTGVKWRVQVPFEVPEDALQGATLVVGRRSGDDRRDDVARIDLGIDAADAERLWNAPASASVRVPALVLP